VQVIRLQKESLFDFFFTRAQKKSNKSFTKKVKEFIKKIKTKNEIKIRTFISFYRRESKNFKKVSGSRIDN